MSEILILLAAHEGGTFIDAQLDSIAAQDHVRWRLVVSDDGSRDDTRARVARFAATQPQGRVVLVGGPEAGEASANFLSLLRRFGGGVPIAFADQDDVWTRDHLSRALRMLDKIPSGQPALYGGRTRIVSQNLYPIGLSPLFRGPFTFRNALVQSFAGGNTMVLNDAAAGLLSKAAMRVRGIVSHDWFAYQVVSGAGGAVLYDREPTVLYRQHGANLVGSNNGPAAQIRRLRALLGGRFRGWGGVNLAALEACSDLLTTDARACLAGYRRLRALRGVAALRALRALGLYRQTAGGRVMLVVAAMLGKL